MIDSKKFINFLKINNISFYCGVPDSILKDFSNEIVKTKGVKHIITPNEGLAISLAAGYSLSTDKLPCVYLQNSGLGNTINPISSIIHKKVYSIPLLLLIGWRGSPKIKDEPQHKVKGLITKSLLKLLGIKYTEISSDLKKIKNLINYAKTNNKPVAILVKKNQFKNKKSNIKISKGILRSDFISTLLNLIKKKTKIISTTGFTSRELFQLRSFKNYKLSKDFYMVGGMGHASSLALGVSISNKNEIICLDGDGALLMHLGSMNLIGHLANKNFKHIIFNNYCHESVGSQSTYSENINFKLLSKSLGYKTYFRVDNNSRLKKILKKFLKTNGPAMLEVKTKIGSLDNLMRPKKLIKLKNDFKNF